MTLRSDSLELRNFQGLYSDDATIDAHLVYRIYRLLLLVIGVSIYRRGFRVVGSNINRQCEGLNEWN